MDARFKLPKIKYKAFHQSLVEKTPALALEKTRCPLSQTLRDARFTPLKTDRVSMTRALQSLLGWMQGTSVQLQRIRTQPNDLLGGYKRRVHSWVRTLFAFESASASSQSKSCLYLYYVLESWTHRGCFALKSGLTILLPAEARRRSRRFRSNLDFRPKQQTYLVHPNSAPKGSLLR